MENFRLFHSHFYLIVSENSLVYSIFRLYIFLTFVRWTFERGVGNPKKVRSCLFLKFLYVPFPFGQFEEVSMVTHVSFRWVNSAERGSEWVPEQATLTVTLSWRPNLHFTFNAPERSTLVFSVKGRHLISRWLYIEGYSDRGGITILSGRSVMSVFF